MPRRLNGVTGLRQPAHTPPWVYRALARQMLHPRTAIPIIALSALSACGFRAYSPPAGWAPAEHVAPLKPDQRSISAALQVGGGIFGPGLIAGAASLRHGLTDSYEIQGQFSYVGINEDSRTSVFKGIVSGRVGLKGLFDKDFEHASWNASIGGGGHGAGGFVTPELGLQVGYENPYLTPWMRTSIFLSQPIAARAVDIAPAGNDEPDFDIPTTTFGFRLGGGFSIRWEEALPLRIHIASEITYLRRVDGRDDVVGGVSLTAETLF